MNGLWLDRLKAIFSDKWSYKLDCLPRCRGRNSSIVSKDVCCLYSSWPTPHVSWPNRATGFADYRLFLPFSQLKHLWAAQLAGGVFTVCGSVTQLLVWMWENHALGLAKLLFGDLNHAGLPVLPGQSVSQISSADEQSCCLGFSLWSLLVWILSAKTHVLVVSNPSSLLPHNQSPCVHPHRFPCSPCGVR